jgi:hypothetical protein
MMKKHQEHRCSADKIATATPSLYSSLIIVSADEILKGSRDDQQLRGLMHLGVASAVRVSLTTD